MRYQLWQKIISFTLIFCLLFSITVRIPFFSFFSFVSADEQKFYNIVSILVNEDIYDSVRSELVRYSQDIQKTLENTRVVILPVPKDASVLDVASLNEKLYFEGYKGVKDAQFESKLVGTVLVGDIPTPIVFDGSKASKTILPYTDFIEKSYVYNHETVLYEKNTDAPTDIIPEIWHGVIAPNSGDVKDNIDLIKAYFDKNHDYYSGAGKFESKKGIPNAGETELADSYEPYVFYYDQFRESKAVNYESYVAYQAYLENLEDITYKRYSAELAQKVQNQVLGVQNEDLQDLIEKAIPGFLQSTGALTPNGPNLENIPDIQTRIITDKATNKFLEVLNSGTLADMRKYVHNAGRYNGIGSQVNVDMVPFIVSILDSVSGQVVKNVATSLEQDIDSIVQNGLSRNILIPVSLSQNPSLAGNSTQSSNGGGGVSGWGGQCGVSYTNILSGKNVGDISNASQCIVYKGSVTNSGTLVEANRGYNIKLSQSDIAECQNYILAGETSNGNVTTTEEMVLGFWAGNTPINLNFNSLATSKFQLNTRDINSSLVPIFDIVGSQKVSDISLTPDPRQCFDNNFILTKQKRYYTERQGGRDGTSITTCRDYFQAPVNGNTPQRWNCGTPAIKYERDISFQDVYQTLGGAGSCILTDLQIAGNSIGKKTEASVCTGSGGQGDPKVCVCRSQTQNYNFKKVTSYITHTSPTSQEFGAQVVALTSPNLPIDKDRYVDFIAANGKYGKINYPYLFRVVPQSNQKLTLETIDIALKKNLDTVSGEINNLISNSDPSSLSGPAKNVYETYLKTGTYPRANVDLYDTLLKKPLQSYDLGGEKKNLSYYDTLVFSVYWNNLKTPSAKYKFIFENYLSDQFGDTDFDFLLPKNKKSYELAYLGAPGDSQNMYIKLDPEEKKQNLFASIIAQNITLQSYLVASSIPKLQGKEGIFKCGPPDGVPIWQWIPAIICWLQDMLPPKIGISEGSCGPSLLTQEEQEEIEVCQGDVNKNGVSDCLEGKLKDGSIELGSDAQRYFYNTPGVLRSTLKDKNGIVVALDNLSYIDFSLAKVEIPKDPLLAFSGTNKQTIFDKKDSTLSSNDAKKRAQQYVSYSDVRTRVVRGTAASYFSTRGKDVNLYFEAKLTARDPQTQSSIISLESNSYEVQVRGDRLFLTSYSIEGKEAKDILVSSKDIVVSDLSQIFLIDTNQKTVEQVSAGIFVKNTLAQKTLLALANYSKNGNTLPLNYPLTIEMLTDGKKVYEEKNISSSAFGLTKELSGITVAGTYQLIVRDASGFIATKNIYLKPERVSRVQVQLGTSVAQTGGNITTHIFTLFDKFNNVASGDIYTVHTNISGNGVVFQEKGQKTLESHVLEGYKAFRLKTTNTADNNTLSFDVKDSSGVTLASTTAQIQTRDVMNLKIIPPNDLVKVGGASYDFGVQVEDARGNIISDLNTRAYMVLNPLYGSPVTPYVEIIGGKGVLKLQTATVAAQKVKLEFQVEGINGIQNSLIDIYPEKPIKVDLSLSQTQIEASPDDSAFLYAVLKDRYGNDVFSDNTTLLNLAIPNEYQTIIGGDSLQKKVSFGKAQFKLSGTEIPGIAHFKIGTTPALQNNSFKLDGQAPFPKANLVLPLMKDSVGLTERGKNFFTEYNSQTYISRFSVKINLLQNKDYLDLPISVRTALSDFWDTTNQLTISGVSENAGTLETFYFWGKEEIQKSNYNAMYSVLLGASYGDVTQENYLAGSLLFDRDNKSLAVTSLLNDPYKFQDIVSFSEQGNLTSVSDNTDITQDIELQVYTDAENRLSFDMTNAALGNYIGTAYYTFDKSLSLSSCTGSLIDCFDKKDTSIVAKTLKSGYSLKTVGGDLVFSNTLSQEVMRITDTGKFIRNSNLSLQLDANNKSQYLKLFLMDGESIVAEIAISYKKGAVNITRDQSLITQKLGVLKNTILVYLKTNMYGTREIYSQNGSSQKVIFYHDPFTNALTLDNFHQESETGIENFASESGAGWEKENTFLLQFAAGESVGESTRNAMSFSLINLGDPVVSMKRIQKTFPGTTLKKSFDATLGEIVSNDTNVVAYQTLDYNNDNKTDVVLAKTDGYIELLENKDIPEHYLKKGNLVFAIDGGPSRLVKTGDFTGDSFDDIFFVSESGEPVLFNNVNKDFSRYSLSGSLSLSGTIIQAEVFDMDKDTKDDIVTLDDAGQIHIFYGTGNSKTPSFTPLKVGDGYGIKLSETTQNYGGAVYFDEIKDIVPDGDYSDIISSSEEYQAQLQESLQDQSQTQSSLFGQQLVERLLFVKLPYSPYVYQENPQTQLIDSLEQSIADVSNPDSAQLLSGSTGALSDFTRDYSGYIDYSSFSGSSSQSTHFLRSEYADNLGLVISKKYKDISPEFLQTGDSVEVELSFKNNSNKTLNNIAYVDTIPRNFKIEKQEIQIISQNNKQIPLKQGIGMYNFLMDGFYLSPGEEVNIKYTLKTLPLKYGYLQVGLFEKGELGDDIYGDVILKPSEKNCGEEADIYTSVSMRSYIKGKVTPSCDAEKLKLPDAIQDNMLDEDNNKVPDYIDSLSGTGSQDRLYSDDDRDGIQNYLDTDYIPKLTDDDLSDFADKVFQDLYADADGDGIPNDEDDIPNYDQESKDFMDTIGDINTAVDQISDQVDTLIEGFSCGFGGGSCISTPLNWAPLAPGGDPTLFGYPIGDGLKVNEGIPIFSALTGINVPLPFGGCMQVPAVYPVSPIMYSGICNGTLGAGGSLGVTSPSNFVRLFATPTLTGGFGIAACFGAPAITAGYANPPGLHPIVPGGNCIVAAMPLLGCKGDEGDPSVVGYPWNYPDFGVINANCPDGYTKKSVGKPQEINSDFVTEFFEYQKTGTITPSLLEKFKIAFSEIAQGGGSSGGIPTGPLISINGGSDSDMGLSIDLDPSALSSGNFQDVVQIQNTRVSAFPDFLMDWVTRQIEEVVNKLTNLPKVFVILPDFSGIFDYGWQDFGSNFQKTFENKKNEKAQKNTNYQTQIDALRAKIAVLSCSGKDSITCGQIENKISLLRQQKNIFEPETLSGIRAAYEFLGNVPLVNIETETINISVPWADASTLDRVLIDWKAAASNWKSEIDRASTSWSEATKCTTLTGVALSSCQNQNSINQKARLDAQKFLQSLERNIEIIEEYKNFPEKLNKLISIKEVRLEQILCNIDAISSMLGGWLSKNGERFKAWVELFVLIKGILKSWQLLIDVFKGYDEECHQCKNERSDLQNFIFRLVSSIIPKLPIIQFPKWPDIILDLHNVRAGINIYLPDFAINLRPIVLPTLPDLKLPDVPSVNFVLPELPILPSFTLPELPELPSLPTVELPDLPPPPKIPKLFGAVEGILNIMKLVTKVMCILKQSPFVPEWRAGDQIAFITERNGFMPMDFIDITLPQFSYPFVDAIKVTTYVNLEFEMEFIVEAVRQVVAPLNSFTNDITNMFQIQVPDFDFSGALPAEINIEGEIDGDIKIDVDGRTIEDASSYNSRVKGLVSLAGLFAYELQKGLQYMSDNVGDTYENRDFVSHVQKQLAIPSIAGNRQFDELRKLWEDIENLTYSKEQSLTESMIENKNKKFETVKNIISTEIQKTKLLKERIKNEKQVSYFQSVSLESEENLSELYQEKMEQHNTVFLKSALALVESPDQSETSYIKDAGQEIMTEVTTGINTYKNQLLSAEIDPATNPTQKNACTYGEADYEYRYKGLYVLEYDKNYRLFEYLEALRGDEKTTALDVDSDGDEDLLYLMSNTLYLKKNHKNTDVQEHMSTPPFVLLSRDNMYFNGDTYHEAINGFEEADVSDSFINISFKKPTDPLLHNFRAEFYSLVDKFRNLDNVDYIPTKLKKFVVDGFEDIEKNTLQSSNENYSVRQHLAYLIDTSVIPGVTLTDQRLINIKDDIAANTIVNVAAQKDIYTGKDSVSFQYSSPSDSKIQTIVLEKHSSIAFRQPIQITSVTGDIFVTSEILQDISGIGLVQHIGKPLLPGARIRYDGDGSTLSESSHLTLRYYDDSVLDLDFRQTYEYRLYDLGVPNDIHLIRLNVKNDFYYAKMRSFKNNILSTLSQQILLSPQTQADQSAPDISLRNKIRIPVYQKKTIDLTENIYEDSGIENIAQVRVDFDLTIDSDNDGNSENDADTNNIRIIQNPTSIKIEFGPYTKLFSKKIRIMLEDTNGNAGFQDVDFQVYTPDPQIQSYTAGILYGEIDETLLNEPVRIYRVRGGTIKKLQDTTGGDIVQTDIGGSYSFGVATTASGLLVKRDGIDIAYVNEYTGKIDIKNPGALINVLSANDPNNPTGFPRTFISLGGKEVFYQYLQTSPTADIDVSGDVSQDTQGESISVKLLDQENLGLYKIPFGVSFNPGAVIGYNTSDSDKKALFSIFRDGRIYTSSERWQLRYKSFGKHAGYQIVDTNNNTVVAEVIMRLEASYILK